MIGARLVEAYDMFQLGAGSLDALDLVFEVRMVEQPLGIAVIDDIDIFID